MSGNRRPMSRVFRRTGSGTRAAPGRGAVALGAARWLSLAGTPVFAAMAVLTGVLESGNAGAICGPGQQPFALGGMTAMYLLMSAFHGGAWLKRLGAGRPAPETALEEGSATAGPSP